MLDKKLASVAVVCVYGDGINGLGIVRSLGRFGAKVIVLSVANQLNFAGFSRYCHEVVEIPYFDSKLLYDALFSISLRCNKKPVLYFDNDKMMIALASYANEVEERFYLTSRLRSVLNFTDKRFQIGVAQKAGINVPKTWYPSSWAELEKIGDGLVGKIIAKPRSTASKGKKAFKSIIAADIDKLIVELQNLISSPEGIIVQEYIEGGDRHIFVALGYKSAKDDYIYLLTGMKLIQFPSGAGVMAVGKTFDSQAVRDKSVALISNMGVSGIFGIEFKYCAKRNEYFFIELNPRCELFHTIGRKAGFELPIIAFKDIYDNSLIGKDNINYKKDYYWINMHAHLRCAYSSKEGIFTRKNILPYLRSIEWSVFSVTDFRPWIRSLGVLTRDVIRKIARHSTGQRES